MAKHLISIDGKDLELGGEREGANMEEGPTSGFQGGEENAPSSRSFLQVAPIGEEQAALRGRS